MELDEEGEIMKLTLQILGVAALGCLCLEAVNLLIQIGLYIYNFRV